MPNRKEWVEFQATVTLKGEYEISDGMVTVRCIHGEKSAQLGGSHGPHLAGHLLSEMARDPSSLDFSNVSSASGPRIWESGFARTTYANPTVLPDADRV